MNDKLKYFVVSVRFSKVGKLYHFEADKSIDLDVGDHVVVETARGWQLGEVAQIFGELSQENDVSWKKIDRKATDEDFQQRKNNEERENKLLEFCRKEIHKQNLEGLKAVSVEYSLDASKISILYSFEGDNKIDLKNLKQAINNQVQDAQVELRQIGPRDVAKIFGGMGACGLPTRCCTKFLTDFSSISIRMAKTQGISLTPSEITGMCGRLRCCLLYEYELYAENRKLLPRRNKRVVTPVGEGKVIDVLPLKMAVIVDVPEVGRKEFFNSDIQTIEVAAQKKSQANDQAKPEPDSLNQEGSPEQKDSDEGNNQDRNKKQYKQSQKGKRPKWRKKRSSNRTKKNDQQ